MPDWYDGPRGGVAGFEGRPHVYASLFDEAVGYSDTFLLMPIDDELWRLAEEDWAIWLRWEAARRAGKTSGETHPALPEDRARHEELKRVIGDRLVPRPDAARRARAEFRPAGGGFLEVRWTVISA